MAGATAESHSGDLRMTTQKLCALEPPTILPSIKKGGVPVLLIGDQQLTQSSSIISYIDDTVYGKDIRTLYPKDSFLRARVSQVVNIVQCDVHPLQNRGLLTIAINDFGMPGQPQRDHPFSVHFMKRGLAALELILEQTAGRFSVGDEITAADVFLIPQLRNAFNAGVDVTSEFPTLNRVWKHCLEHSEIRATLIEFGGLPT